MREYAKVGPKAWHGQTFKALRKRGAEALLVGLYLMTSPNSNMLGLYSQPILYMAHETGLGEEGAKKGLDACIEAGFCSYDSDTEMVWVHEMAKYQVAATLKATDLRCKGIQKDYDALPDNPFLGAFFDRYCDAFHLSEKREFGKGTCQAPTQAPTKPRTRAGAGAGERTGSPSLRSGETGANESRRTRRVDGAITLATYLERCKAEGRKPIPPDHFLRADCRDAGITDEMLQVAWIVFRRKYTEDEKTKGKRYKDWPGHFANAINGRWGGLWVIDPVSNQAQWSSTGLQQKTILDARAKAREEQHDHA